MWFKKVELYIIKQFKKEKEDFIKKNKENNIYTDSDLNGIIQSKSVGWLKEDICEMS